MFFRPCSCTKQLSNPSQWHGASVSAGPTSASRASTSGFTRSLSAAHARQRWAARSSSLRRRACRRGPFARAARPAASRGRLARRRRAVAARTAAGEFVPGEPQLHVERRRRQLVARHVLGRGRAAARAAARRACRRASASAAARAVRAPAAAPPPRRAAHQQAPPHRRRRREALRAARVALAPRRPRDRSPTAAADPAAARRPHAPAPPAGRLWAGGGDRRVEHGGVAGALVGGGLPRRVRQRREAGIVGFGAGSRLGLQYEIGPGEPQRDASDRERWRRSPLCGLRIVAQTTRLRGWSSRLSRLWSSRRTGTRSPSSPAAPRRLRR